jgi:O-antigen ligase
MSGNLILFIFLYAIWLTVRSISIDGFNLRSIWLQVYVQLAPLMLCLLIINRLMSDIKNFVKLFFIFLCPAVALNCIFNILYTASFVNSIGDLVGMRLGGETIGLATGKEATTYAIVYSLFCISSLIIATESKSSILKIIYGYFAFVLFLGLLFTKSRGPFIGELICFAHYFLDSKIALNKRNRYIISIVLFFLLLFVAYFLNLEGRLFYDSGRITLWKQVAEIIYDHPYLGYGENDFYVYIKGTQSYLYHGHNLIINSLLRGGILGCALMIFILLCSLYRTWQIKKFFHVSIPLYLIIDLLVSGLVDFDPVIREKNWDWVGIWIPIFIAGGADTFLNIHGVRISDIFRKSSRHPGNL